MMAGVSAANLPRPGDMVAGKYVIERLLGQGGMGAVFAARHVKLAKPVAIKIMLADAANPEAAHRFINEGRAAANIQNEHVVRVDDVDEELGYAYMVLELLDGEDLAQVLERKGKLPPGVAAEYALQALRGVMQAHAIGIVHRDLKPSNLFLARRKDGSVVVKVLDFGISKAQGSSALLASPNALTSTKAMLGSPLYMSPEQLRSSKSVDQRADIWAMGIILYELVTGMLPFNGDNLGELFAAILEMEPRPASAHIADLPPAFEAVITRCLQRRVENRFQNAAELMQALAPFASADASLNAPVGGFGPPSRPSLESTPSAPSPGATTTGDVGRDVARGGTLAMSPGSTPVGMVHPQAGWQTTGGSSNGLPRSRTPVALLAAAFGLVAIIGLAGIGVSVVRKRDRAATLDSAALPVPIASSLSVPPSPPSATLVATPSASIPPPASATTATGGAAKPTPTGTHRPPPTATVTAPPPTATAPPPTATAPPPTATAPKKPGGDNLQNSR